MSVVWVDASSGASGDMLLGALVDAGVPLSVISSTVDAVAPEPVDLGAEKVRRGALAATRCHVSIADSVHHRTWTDVRALLTGAALDDAVRDLALRVFERLAVAEGAVHGIAPDDVHFHEVGALDAIADVVGVCAGFAHLAPAVVVVSPVAVGSGTVRAAHGTLPVPPPAVARLLTGVPSFAGPPGHPSMEMCTPTGAALLTTLATSWGDQPPMATRAIGVGAGGRDPEGWSNTLRLLIGDPAVRAEPAAGGGIFPPWRDNAPAELVIEANIDDLEPRLMPGAIDALLAAGARDAWVTPILMKKGRPAYTLHALTRPDAAEAVRRAFFRETSTIGVREHEVVKHALPREILTVNVDGHPIAVKAARLDGEIVNLQPEWDDVARAAAELGRPAIDVLAEARAAPLAPLVEPDS
ncbi:nickel pincer cofactor biosynthesis protein LarC [Nocardioides sp. KC13]|uniref:Pyridinium-3,5-bisthiocarboxylic acid mononucleotide nickel insertion protein n=1 Tax=Nocardioides turkmenicus TaxID=2711220 RepID=A0A6M1R3P4_9ACTN|nr:nickel pincer cofactor biosynthesis protein LarC [Nocardioides sp. KC13]NGN92318.1 nickel pincer cofactor biosynthesis protein LarC [Nocardioides sp. KC13]